MDEITQQRVSKRNSQRVFMLQAELNKQSNFILPNFDSAVGYLLDQNEKVKELEKYVKTLEGRVAVFEKDNTYED